MNLNNDRPLTDQSKDRLGFTTMSAQLARAIVENDLSDGLVVGIEGAWGSGKTTLVEFALQELEQSESPTAVIRFQPWLIGKREDLLGELFSQLEHATDKLDLQTSDKIKTKNLLKKYSAAASGIAVLAEHAGALGVPYAGLFANVLEATGKKANESAHPPLGNMKSLLKRTLEESPTPIIVFVDDLDRLDPDEAVEVLRLIRSVADFPSIAYVVTYDLEILARNINAALKIDDGSHYVEKIVQVSFRIPRPLSHDLLSWFREAAEDLVFHKGEDQHTATYREQYERFETAVRDWLPICVNTPRDVIRTLNALRLYALPIRGQFDPGDMIFLQLVRLKMPLLFKWVEDYVSSIADTGTDMFLVKHRAAKMQKELGKIVEDAKAGNNDLLSILRRHLPDIDAKFVSIQDGGAIDIGTFEWTGVFSATPSKDKRLASANHFRIYFAFSMPDGSLPDRELHGFIENVGSNPRAASNTLNQWAKQQRPQGGMMARLLLSRIIEHQDSLDAKTIQSLFSVISENMDDLVKHTFNGVPSPTELGGRDYSIFGIIRNIDEEERKDILKQLFKRGMPYSWLTPIIRDLTFEHGLVGDSAKPEGLRLLDDKEFKMIRQRYLEMLQNEDPEILLKVPDILSLLFSWLQAGDKEGVRTWISSQSRTDQGLLQLLDRMGCSDSGRDDAPRLRPKYLDELFGGSEDVKQRVTEIKDKTDNQELHAQALRILDAMEKGAEIEQYFS